MPRFIKNILIIGYLWITALALVMTILRAYVPLAPYSWVQWAYGMMAPYQSDDPINFRVVATGYASDGTSQRIELAPYLPYGFGERNAREMLRLHDLPLSALHRSHFVAFGLRILEQERARGRYFTHLDLALHFWERSPAGYEFLHQPLFTNIVPLVTVQ